MSSRVRLVNLFIARPVRVNEMNEMKYPIDDIAPRDAALTIFGGFVAVREFVSYHGHVQPMQEGSFIREPSLRIDL